MVESAGAGNFFVILVTQPVDNPEPVPDSIAGAPSPPDRVSRRRRADRRRRGRGRYRWLALASSIVVAAGITIAVLAFHGTHAPAPAHVPAAVTKDPPAVRTLSPALAFGDSYGISDPFVLATSKLDYMYGSGLDGVWQLHLPERTFTVMSRLSPMTDAMPTLPAWVRPGTGLWAPDVRRVGPLYVMWFSGHDRLQKLPSGKDAECISVATSTSPTGPFLSSSPAPVLCDVAQYGDIDPRTFIAPDGQEWLYWKNDGNAGSFPTNIYAQRLASDGRTLIGQASLLLTNDLPWEGIVIEAPDMVHVDGRYLLFFSGTISEGPASGIGLARCDGPGGPCTSPYAGPWFGSNVQGAGPDEETIYTQNGVTWMLYTPNAVYYPFALPQLAAARIAFTANGMPYIADRQGMVPGVTAGGRTERSAIRNEMGLARP